MKPKKFDKLHPKLLLDPNRVVTIAVSAPSQGTHFITVYNVSVGEVTKTIAECLNKTGFKHIDFLDLVERKKRWEELPAHE